MTATRLVENNFGFTINSGMTAELSESFDQNCQLGCTGPGALPSQV